MANMAAQLLYCEFSKATSALALERPEPKFPGLLVPGLKKLLNKGLSRGAIAEISGRRSSGRTSIALHIVAQATARGEICAVIDLHDSFHPASAHAAGVGLERIVWVRCQGNAEHAMRATDLLLHAGGFGVVLLDLCDASARVLNRIPLSYWYRFRRGGGDTAAILLVSAGSAQTRGALLSLEVKRTRSRWSGQKPFMLLRGIESKAALRSSLCASESLAIRSA